MAEIKDKLQKIKIFAMDVDGVLTDCGMYYSERGEVMKKFNTRDGMAIELLKKNGIIPVIITKENSNIVLKRAEKLKIDEAHVGVDEKVELMEKLLQRYNADFSEVAYLGDDINDLELLKKVGVSITVADALEGVKEVVDYITSKKGGEGVVREAADMVINSR